MSQAMSFKAKLHMMIDFHSARLNCPYKPAAFLRSGRLLRDQTEVMAHVCHDLHYKYSMSAAAIARWIKSSYSSVRYRIGMIDVELGQTETVYAVFYLRLQSAARKREAEKKKTDRVSKKSERQAIADCLAEGVTDVHS